MTIYAPFADVFDYPVAGIEEAANACAAGLARDCPEGCAHMTAFLAGIGGKTLGQLQELYTHAFDLRPDCTPNLGYHLFGDEGRRGLFLAELKGRLLARGVDCGSELPDHISLVLRYMDLAEEEREALIEDCLLPAVARMAEILDAVDNPYKHALRALLAFLQRQHEAAGESAEVVSA